LRGINIFSSSKSRHPACRVVVTRRRPKPDEGDTTPRFSAAI